MKSSMQRLLNYQLKMYERQLQQVTLTDEVVVQKSLSYIEDGAHTHTYDYIVPERCSQLESLPLLINVHGGAFATGDKKQNRSYASQLAAMGCQVVVLNYRLVPEVNLKQQVQDVVGGIKFALENYSHEQGFFLTGDSSGALLVTIICCLWTDIELQKIYEVEVPDVKIMAAGLTGTPNTMNIYPKLMIPYARENRRMLLDGCPEIIGHTESEDIWNAKVPPLFLMSAKGDPYYKSVRRLDVWLTHIGAVHTNCYCEKAEEGKLFHCFNVIRPDWQCSKEMNQKMFAMFCELMNNKTPE